VPSTARYQCGGCLGADAPCRAGRRWYAGRGGEAWGAACREASSRSWRGVVFQRSGGAQRRPSSGPPLSISPRAAPAGAGRAPWKRSSTELLSRSGGQDQPATGSSYERSRAKRARQLGKVGSPRAAYARCGAHRAEPIAPHARARPRCWRSPPEGRWAASDSARSDDTCVVLCGHILDQPSTLAYACPRGAHTVRTAAGRTGGTAMTLKLALQGLSPSAARHPTRTRRRRRESLWDERRRSRRRRRRCARAMAKPPFRGRAGRRTCWRSLRWRWLGVRARCCRTRRRRAGGRGGHAPGARCRDGAVFVHALPDSADVEPAPDGVGSESEVGSEAEVRAEAEVGPEPGMGASLAWAASLALAPSLA